MLRITDAITIDESELDEKFVRSPGPGGQNVNKLSTAVQLRFPLGVSPSLPDDVRIRAMRLAGRRLTDSGELLIEAHRHRSRERNRVDARERLVALLRRAAEPPRPRKKTVPSRGAREQRLAAKRHRSDAIRRRRVSDD